MTLTYSIPRWDEGDLSSEAKLIFGPHLQSQYLYKMGDEDINDLSKLSIYHDNDSTVFYEEFLSESSYLIVHEKLSVRDALITFQIIKIENQH
tara:strand:- start:807 stop:1085 length:279 start_codon:yes stop_codon:yes gene_type:complete